MPSSSSWAINPYRESYHKVTIYFLVLICFLIIVICYFLFPKGVCAIIPIPVPYSNRGTIVEIGTADQHQQDWGALTFKVKEVGNPVGKHSTLTASHTVSQKLFWILAKGFTSFWPTGTNPYTRVCATKGAWINTYGDWKVDYSKQNEGQTEISGTLAPVHQNYLLPLSGMPAALFPYLY